MLAAAQALAPHFAPRLIDWQRTHGRSTLPWQNTRDPYRVWLSEIMLQQTQVATVQGYYARFLDRFPTVAALAEAPVDAVLGLWSGLGYYSRAHNLHRCAQAVMARFGGAFPDNAAALATLPGIGRSTAAAIAAFCFGERVAILDGNVKRVLGRVLAFDGDLARAAQERLLWQAASALLPPAEAPPHASTPEAIATYTQGLMDLGATCCLPRQPQCPRCPVQSLCEAQRLQATARYPVKSRTLRRSAQSLWLLLARRADGAVWLARRPARGIWAGLYTPPIFDERAALQAACPPAALARLQTWPPFMHALTHKDLTLHPVLWPLPAGAEDPPAGPGQWVAATAWPALGLPAPVRKLLLAAAEDGPLG